MLTRKVRMQARIRCFVSFGTRAAAAQASNSFSSWRASVQNPPLFAIFQQSRGNTQFPGQFEVCFAQGRMIKRRTAVKIAFPPGPLRQQLLQMVYNWPVLAFFTGLNSRIENASRLPFRSVVHSGKMINPTHNPLGSGSRFRCVIPF